MGCKVGSKENTAVQLMFEGVVDDATICRAIDDAVIFTKVYDGLYNDDTFSMLVRYYSCHLLYIWGFARSIDSKSINKISESRKTLELGDKENSSPYLFEFHKLLEENESFFVSI